MSDFQLTYGTKDEWMQAAKKIEATTIERCAQVVEEFEFKGWVTADKIAAAIGARGNTSGEATRIGDKR